MNFFIYSDGVKRKYTPGVVRTQRTAKVRAVDRENPKLKAKIQAYQDAAAEHRQHVPERVATVADLMQHKPITLTPNSTIQEAWRLMVDKNFHHLPIVKVRGSQQIAGIISDRDLLRHYDEVNDFQLGKTRPVSDIMATQLLVTNTNTDIRQAAKVMFDEKVSCLLVLEDKYLRGIITRTDILRAVISYGDMTLYL